MALLIIFYFSAAISEILLGFFIISKNPRSKTSLPLLLLITSTFIWQAGTALTLLAKDPLSALFFTKVAFLGIALIPISTYHLTINVLDIKNTITLPVGYAIAFLFIPLGWTHFILNGVHTYSWGFFFKWMAKLPFLLALSQWAKQPFQGESIFLKKCLFGPERYMGKLQKTCAELAVKKNVIAIPAEP